MSPSLIYIIYMYVSNDIETCYMYVQIIYCGRRANAKCICIGLGLANS